MTSKILTIDIETRPAKAYTWGVFKVNIGYEQIIEPGGIICFAAKWLGEKDTVFYSDWTHSREEMLRAAHKLLSEADAVVGYNSDKFDLAKLNGEFMLIGLPPVPPLTSIDLVKQVRKFGFIMNRLAYIGPLLKIGGKVKHEGFDLWVKVMAGDEKSQAKMEKYNRQDVVLTEKLYLKIRPYIRNHPHLGDTKSECGACGSNHVQSRGTRRTKAFKIQRIQCQSCGSWSDGKRTKIG